MATRQRSAYQRIYDVVRRIPRGRVATYGQVAVLAGRRGHARQVGYALSALPDDSAVPWHRVINHRGAVSRRADPGPERYQETLLAAEGIEFDARGRVALAQYQWRPRRTPPPTSDHASLRRTVTHRSDTGDS